MIRKMRASLFAETRDSRIWPACWTELFFFFLTITTTRTPLWRDNSWIARLLEFSLHTWSKMREKNCILEPLFTARTRKMKVTTRSCNLESLDCIPVVDVHAIDAYVTLQFSNSAEWQESDTLGQHSRGSYTRDIDLRTSRLGRGPAKRE